MKKLVIFIIIIAIILTMLVSLIIFSKNYLQETGKAVENKDTEEKEQEKQDTEEDKLTEATGDSKAGAGAGAGGGGGNGGGAGTGGTENGIELPPDFHTRECGFYFEEYDVCGGTCPSGTCTSEGRSCYCKEI